jgi:hypothetical protein
MDWIVVSSEYISVARYWEYSNSSLNFLSQNLLKETQTYHKNLNILDIERYLYLGADDECRH